MARQRPAAAGSLKTPVAAGAHDRQCSVGGAEHLLLPRGGPAFLERRVGKRTLHETAFRLIWGRRRCVVSLALRAGNETWFSKETLAVPVSSAASSQIFACCVTGFLLPPRFKLHGARPFARRSEKAPCPRGTRRTGPRWFRGIQKRRGPACRGPRGAPAGAPLAACSFSHSAGLSR